MKSTLLVSLLFFFLHGFSLQAQTNASKGVAWEMTLGCRHCHFGDQLGVTTCKGNCGPAATKDGTVYELTGAEIPKDFKKGGQWLVKGTVAADGKSIAVTGLTALKPTEADIKDTKPSAISPGAGTYTGTVGRTGAGLPMLTGTDKVVYHLKAAKTASAPTSYTLTRIGGGELIGTFTATGSTYEDDSHRWIVVESIQANAAP